MFNYTKWLFLLFKVSFGVTICWLVVKRRKFCVNCFNHKSAVINNIISRKLCVVGKNSIRWAKKKIIEKEEMSKMPTVNQYF